MVPKPVAAEPEDNLFKMQSLTHRDKALKGKSGHLSPGQSDLRTGGLIILTSCTFTQGMPGLGEEKPVEGSSHPER